MSSNVFGGGRSSAPPDDGAETPRVDPLAAYFEAIQKPMIAHYYPLRYPGGVVSFSAGEPPLLDRLSEGDIEAFRAIDCLADHAPGKVAWPRVGAFLIRKCAIAPAHTAGMNVRQIVAIVRDYLRESAATGAESQIETSANEPSDADSVSDALRALVDAVEQASKTPPRDKTPGDADRGALIPCTYLRSVIPQEPPRPGRFAVAGDASKVAQKLRHAGIEVVKVAGRNCVYQRDLLNSPLFRQGSKLYALIEQYGDS